jgi:hypothetical protein
MGKNAMAISEVILSGHRPAIPASVSPVAKQLIEACWSENPSDRPDFESIFRVMKDVNFQLIPGSSLPRIKAYVDEMEKLEQKCSAAEITFY